VRRTLLVLLALIALTALIAAACTDALPDAPPAPLTLSAAAEPQEAASEPGCGWLRWTDARVSLVDWFAANPQTPALHWWDAHAGEFRTVRRGAAASALYDALAPGTLVWQERDGDSAPRTFSLDHTMGLIRLQRGVNLVPWRATRPAVSLRDALRWIGPQLISAAAVSADGSSCRALPLRNWWGQPPALTDGDLLALELRHDAAWLQPWAQPPQLLLGAGVDPDAQDELWREWHAVSGYMASRYAAAVALRAVALQPDYASFVRAFELLLAQELAPGAWPSDACGGEVAGWIGLIVGCQQPIAFDHEYVHALQHDAATGGLGAAGEIRPFWLVEGMAMYLSARYRSDAGYEDYQSARRWAVHNARAFGGPLPLYSLETYLQWRSSPPVAAYAVGFLAAEWLAAQAGDDALFLFMRRLQRGVSRWHEAFDIAFGLSLDEFYGAFDAHALLFNRPRPHRVSGVLLDPDGAPVAGMRVYAYPEHGGWGEYDLSDSRGRFAVRLPAGRYAVAVQSGSRCTLYGYYRDGQALAPSSDPTIVEASARHAPAITIRLPAAPSALRGWSTCDQPEGAGWLSGSVLAPDGRGVPNVDVLACDVDTWQRCAHAETGPDGAYALDAPPGEYALILGPADDSCLAWGARSPTGGLTQSPDIGVIPIDQTPIRGVDILLPAPPQELAAHDHCW